MMKTRHILAASAIAITAMATSYIAASSIMAEAAQARQDAQWQSQAAAYKSDVRLERPNTVNVNLTASDFIVSNGASMTVRDYDQTQALSPVTFAHHDAAERLTSERSCLAQAIYYEARSERRSGQMAVAEVVLNRVKSKHYPNSICGVVYQGSGRNAGCQFSFMCDGSTDKAPKGKHWDTALEISAFMQTHTGATLTKGATHYHTTAIIPKWSANLRYDRQIGTHKFYRFNFTERPSVNAPPIAIAPPI